MKIDLHIHSTASDGGLPPREVVERAVAGGLDIIAIADHDTVGGYAEAARAAGGRLHVLPALEISARHRDRSLHILGYFVDPEAAQLLEYTRGARQAREVRIRQMIGRLAELDVAIGFDAVVAEAGPDAHALARPHLARALLSAGHVASVPEAFERFIGDEGPAYVASETMDVPGAIELIHRAGGIAVWAHPPLALLGTALGEFVEAGLDGLEAYRPRLPQPDLNRIVNKARTHGLLLTGGSDWHGDWHGPLGSFHLGRAELGDFLERGRL